MFSGRIQYIKVASHLTGHIKLLVICHFKAAISGTNVLLFHEFKQRFVSLFGLFITIIFQKIPGSISLINTPCMLAFK